ncbi:MAG TPA: twin-arginine translocase TatA/TatE family subunit [Anaerolineales bacterium]|nr:twin-arginine translocase TatA/TatE family subunit [Anaerolineales bacterium]
MFDIGAPELLIVLVIVILLFGPGRIARTMGELGKGLRSFKQSISSDEESASTSDPNTPSKSG